MIATTATLTITLICLVCPCHCWLQPCGPEGFVDCLQINADYPESINGTVTVSDCTYLNCPQIQVRDNSTVLFINVTFVNSSSVSDGGAITTALSSVEFRNCQFINCSSVKDGGAIKIDPRGIVSLYDCVFIGCTTRTGNGAAFYSWQGNLYLKNVSFINCTAPGDHNGGAIAWQGGNFTWSGGGCFNNVAHWGACYYQEGDNGGSTQISDIKIDGCYANSGAAFFVNNAALTKFLFRNITVTNTRATERGCLYAYHGPVINIYDSVFDGKLLVPGYGGQRDQLCYKLQEYLPGCTAASGGFAYLQTNVRLNLTRTIISNSASNEGGAICISDNAQLYVINSKFINGSAPNGGIIYADGPNAKMVFTNSAIVGGSAGFGGALFLSASKEVVTYINDTLFVNNRADFHGGAIQAVTTAKVYVNKGTVFRNNFAEGNGGAVNLEDSATMFVDNDANFLANSAGLCGGALSMAGTKDSSIQFLNGNTSVVDNTAPKGSAICLTAGPKSTLKAEAKSLPSIRGELWVDNAESAVSLLRRDVLSHFPSLKPKGKAAQLIVRQGHVTGNGSVNDLANITVNIREMLPNFTVTAKDVFENTCPVVLGTPVIVQLVERSNTTIDGEYAKAILNEETGSVMFTGLTLEANPGSYAIEVTAVKGTIDHIDLYPWPIIHVKVSTCKPGIERFIPAQGRCFTIRSSGAGARIASGIVATICFVLAVSTAAGLQKFKHVKIVKANSVTFLSLCCVGSALGLLSLTSSIGGQSESCVASPWFDHMGFTFVFAAILLKTYRIQRIFDVSANNAGVGMKLHDKYLIRYFMVACIAMAAFMITWTVQMPPYPQETLVFNTFVTIDQCTVSSFSTAVMFIRLAVQLLACWLAYSIRKVHADFNESRFILFATYNWAIFGALLEVLASKVIVDPEISYIIHAISIIVPHVITTVLLGSIKVYECIFMPEAASGEAPVNGKEAMSMGSFRPKWRVQQSQPSSQVRIQPCANDTGEKPSPMPNVN